MSDRNYYFAGVALDNVKLAINTRCEKEDYGNIAMESGCWSGWKKKLSRTLSKRKQYRYNPDSNTSNIYVDYNDGPTGVETIGYRPSSLAMSLRPRMPLPEGESDKPNPRGGTQSTAPPRPLRPTHSLPPQPKYVTGVVGQSWFWGPLSMDESAKLLKPKPNGAFVVRDSSDDNHLYTITFKRDDRISSIRISGISGLFSLHQNPHLAQLRYTSPVDLINSYISMSTEGKQLRLLNIRNETVPFHLKYPLRRFGDQVHSLRDLSRFVIRLSFRRDQLDYLPIPEHLKPYLTAEKFWPRPDVLRKPQSPSEPENFYQPTAER